MGRPHMQRTLTSSLNWRMLALLLIPGTLWGISFVFNEYVLRTIPPLTMTMTRSAIAMVPLGGVFLARGGKLPTSASGWLPYLILGTFNNTLPFALIAWGQLQLDPGLATILTSLMPLFTAIFAHFFTESERLNRTKTFGVMLGFVGVVMLVGPTALEGLTLNFWSQLAILGSSVSYAGAAIYARKHLARSADSSRMTAILQLISLQYLMSSLTLFPFVLMVDRPWHLQPSPASIGALLVIALPITLGATFIYYYLIDRLGASIAATTIYLIPINGVLWGALLLGERVSLLAILALVIILVGVAIVNRGK